MKGLVSSLVQAFSSVRSFRAVLVGGEYRAIAITATDCMATIDIYFSLKGKDRPLPWGGPRDYLTLTNRSWAIILRACKSSRRLMERGTVDFTSLMINSVSTGRCS